MPVNCHLHLSPIHVIYSLTPNIRKQDTTIWLRDQKCEVLWNNQPRAINCISLYHVPYNFCLCYTWGFLIGSLILKAVEHTNNEIILLRGTIKSDSPKFYLHVFCLLYGFDASLDLPLMLLASKLLRYKRSLPLPFFPLALWVFEAALCFKSVTA